MDRTKLAERNRRLANFQHRLTAREQLRRQMLRLLALAPVPPLLRPQKNTILLIRPDHLGDMLLTMPAIQALRQAQPDARLIGLTGEWSAPVMAAYPEVDTVLTLPFPGFTRKAKQGGIINPYLAAWQWARQLRMLRIETAVLLRPDHWWGALLAWLAGIPNRIGYGLPDVRPFLTEAIPPLTEAHTVAQSLRLLRRWTGSVDAASLKMTYPVHADDRTHITDLLQEHGLAAGRQIIVIHPGAGTTFKRWLPEYWTAVAGRLAERFNAAVIFTGSDQEQGVIMPIMGKLRAVESHSLAGETNVAQLAALYERALVVLGPDSGPLHLAVAAGAPTVHLYGPADPAKFGPWGDPTRQIVLTSGIGCRPCNILAWPGDSPDLHPCIRDITPRQVIEAAISAVERR
ncbi:MAG: glycosyltransferase family 9 protein [Anaerolineae bacterium]